MWISECRLASVCVCVGEYVTKEVCVRACVCVCVCMHMRSRVREGSGGGESEGGAGGGLFRRFPFAVIMDAGSCGRNTEHHGNMLGLLQRGRLTQAGGGQPGPYLRTPAVHTGESNRSRFTVTES